MLRKAKLCNSELPILKGIVGKSRKSLCSDCCVSSGKDVLKPNKGQHSTERYNFSTCVRVKHCDASLAVSQSKANQSAVRQCVHHLLESALLKGHLVQIDHKRHQWDTKLHGFTRPATKFDTFTHPSITIYILFRLQSLIRSLTPRL